MYEWRNPAHWAIAILLLFGQCLIAGVSFGADGVWEPSSNDFICGADLNGNGQWTETGEAQVCDKGATFSPEQANQTGFGYITNPASYTCPIDRVSCNTGTAYFCPFNGQRCELGSNTCSRNQSCNLFQETYQKYESCLTNQRTETGQCVEITKTVDGQIVKGSRCSITNLEYWENEVADGKYKEACASACRTTIPFYTCPLSGNEYANQSQCSQACWEWDQRDKYRCPITGAESYSYNECSANCKETQSCTAQKEFSCPLGDQFACVNLDPTNSTDNFACSANACGAYNSNNEESPVNSEIYVNDGDYSEEGVCLGRVMIFGGRPMDCRLPGISSAYQDCCGKDDGEIYHDSMGSLMDTYSYMETISTAYEAAAVAYNAYQAGATAAEAATAATDFLATSFDPTTLAITVAIMLIMNYLEKACPPDDIETAIMDASGYCVTLGNKCTKKWFGSCVQEVEVKCCFSSKLARIIHEQGRPQLGITFGTSDEPNCRGFDAEEFQSLDFSKIDLSEYYDELRHRNQTELQQELSTTISNKVGG